jgi:hypothetical protein
MRYLERSEMRIASPCQGEAAPSARVRVRIPGCPCARWAAIWNLDPHPTLEDERRPLPDRERLLECGARDELDAGALTRRAKRAPTSPGGRGIGAAIWNLDPHPTLVEDRSAAGTAARPTVGGGAPYCWIS